MVLKLSTGKRIWLQCLTGGFLATWEDSRSILSLISLCPQGSFCWKFASIYGRTGRMRARLWLSICQSERGFKGEETAQVGSESAVLHWKLTSASHRLPLLVIPRGSFCKVQETLYSLAPVSWLCCLKIIITTDSCGPVNWYFGQYHPLQILSPMIMMGLATSNNQKTITEHLCSVDKMLPNKCFHFFSMLYLVTWNRIFYDHNEKTFTKTGFKSSCFYWERQVFFGFGVIWNLPKFLKNLVRNSLKIKMQR